MRKHVQNCASRPVRCSECSALVAPKDATAHNSEMESEMATVTRRIAAVGLARCWPTEIIHMIATYDSPTTMHLLQARMRQRKYKRIQFWIPRAGDAHIFFTALQEPQAFSFKVILGMWVKADIPGETLLPDVANLENSWLWRMRDFAEDIVKRRVPKTPEFWQAYCVEMRKFLSHATIIDSLSPPSNRHAARHTS